MLYLLHIGEVDVAAITCDIFVIALRIEGHSRMYDKAINARDYCTKRAVFGIIQLDKGTIGYELFAQ